MDIMEQLQLKRLEDVDIFGDRNRASFAPASRAIVLFDELKTVIAGLQAAQQQQSVGAGSSAGATRSKSVLLGEMWRDIGQISETARQMRTLSDPQKGVFSRPLTKREEVIVGAARTFVAQATPIWNLFVAYELSPTLLAEIQSDLDDYDAAYSTQQGQKQERIGAGTGIEDGLEQGTAILDELRPIVNNKFARDEETLRAWKSVTRYPQRPKKTPPPA